MTRLVAESGGIINGGLAQVGSCGVTLREALLHELARA